MTPLPRVYVESVIPEVKAFRDKIGAQVVWVSQNKKDNEAERLASVIPTLTFNGAHYVASGFK